MAKDVCKNCGAETNLKIATGLRQKLGYCVDCFRQRRFADIEESRIDRGEDTRNIYRKRPFDSRMPEQGA